MAEFVAQAQVAMIYVINLQRRPDRLADMARQLDSLGLNWQRIDAVDAAEGISLDCGVRFSRHWRSLPLRDAEKAVALSHRKVWEILLASVHPEAIILEDDVVIDRQLADLGRNGLGLAEFPLPVKIEFFEQPWLPVVLLGASYGRAATAPGTVRRLHSCYLGAAGYVVTRSAAERLLRRTRRVNRPIDWVLFDPALLRSDSAAAVLLPPMVSQIGPAMPSDIGERGGSRQGFWMRLARRFTLNLNLRMAELIYRPERFAVTQDWRLGEDT